MYVRIRPPRRYVQEGGFPFYEVLYERQKYRFVVVDHGKPLCLTRPDGSNAKFTSIPVQEIPAKLQEYYAKLLSPRGSVRKESSVWVPERDVRVAHNRFLRTR